MLTKLGKFPQPLDISMSTGSQLDYSGMCATPSGDILHFGGGHAASAMANVMRLPSGASAWVSDYDPVPRGKMFLKDLTPTKFWTTPGYTMQPIAVHSYSMLQWSSAVKRMVKLHGSSGAPYDNGFGEPGVAAALTGGAVGHYDPATKTWEDCVVTNPSYATASAEDPISGQILSVVGGSYQLYDPRTKTFGKVNNYLSTLNYDTTLIYFPPTDKFYYFARNTNGQLGVYEITLDRTTMTCAAPVLMKYFRPYVAGAINGTTHYAYDPDQQLIVGALSSNLVFGFDPRKGWFSHPAPGAGSINFHHWAYDAGAKRHIVITLSSDTYAFVWEPALAAAIPIPPPEIVAPVNGKVGTLLQDACNLGTPVTVGDGVLRVGAIVSKPGTTITGSGSAKTSIINGGSILGKGAIVVQGDTAIKGICFQDVTVSDGNGAGIRHDKGTLTVDDVHFLRCQDGYLGNANVAFANCLVEDCGAGDGQTHGIYVSNGSQVASATNCVFRGTKIGHHFKSRALKSTVANCQFEAATESYSLNFPWGGVVTINACTIAQGKDTDNDVIISIGEEGDSTVTVHSFDMSDCTITSTGVDNATGIRFNAKVAGLPVHLTNVHFVGVKVPVTGATPVYKGCTADGVAIPDSDGTVTPPPPPPDPTIDDRVTALEAANVATKAVDTAIAARVAALEAWARAVQFKG